MNVGEFGKNRPTFVPFLTPSRCNPAAARSTCSTDLPISRALAKEIRAGPLRKLGDSLIKQLPQRLRLDSLVPIDPRRVAVEPGVLRRIGGLPSWRVPRARCHRLLLALTERVPTSVQLAWTCHRWPHCGAHLPLAAACRRRAPLNTAFCHGQWLERGGNAGPGCHESISRGTVRAALRLDSAAFTVM